MSSDIFQALGLDRNPFSMAADTEGYFHTDATKQILDELAFGILSRKGFSLLTGEVGVGKTSLLYQLLRRLEAENLVTSWIFNTMLNKEELLLAIGRDFGLDPPKTANVAQLVDLLQGFLVEQNTKDKNCAIIVDEAHNLSLPALEALRMLSNLEAQGRKLVQILLVGQPELKARLDEAKLRQLRSRITIYKELAAFNREETGQYVNFKLASASSQFRLDKSPLKILFRSTCGNTRMINLVMERALYATVALGERDITDKALKAAVAEIATCQVEVAERVAASGRRTTYAVALATALVLCVLALVPLVPAQSGRVSVAGLVVEKSTSWWQARQEAERISEVRQAEARAAKAKAQAQAQTAKDEAEAREAEIRAAQAQARAKAQAKKNEAEAREAEIRAAQAQAQAKAQAAKAEAEAREAEIRAAQAAAKAKKDEAEARERQAKAKAAEARAKAAEAEAQAAEAQARMAAAKAREREAARKAASPPPAKVEKTSPNAVRTGKDSKNSLTGLPKDGTKDTIVKRHDTLREYPEEYREFLAGSGLESLLPSLGRAVELKQVGVFLRGLPKDVQLVRLDRLPETDGVKYSVFPWKKYTNENPAWLGLWKPPFVIKDFSYGYRSTDILTMQRMLKRLGYYWGPDDGMVGPITWRAINTFQKDMKLKRTMWPDPETVFWLTVMGRQPKTKSKS